MTTLKPGNRDDLRNNPPQRIVVKVGSAVLGGPAGLDGRALLDLVQGISDLIDDGRQVVLVSSGAILAGMQVLGLTQRPTTLPQKQACAAIGQIDLMSRYRFLFQVRGVDVAQILLTAGDFHHRRRFLNARNTLEALFGHKVLPIVNENDTVAVEEIKLGDNDNLSCLMLNLVGADLLVLLSDVDGLYDKDPKQYPEARSRGTIEPDELLEGYTEASPLEPEETPRSGSVGTGGILTKLEAARRAVSMGVPVIWAGGKTHRVLERILAGEPLGTWFRARSGVTTPTHRKSWMASIRRVQGSIVIDEGAAGALVQGQRSLLPSGIVAVTGEFFMGDMVAVLGPGGRPIGRGLVSYSSQEIRAIQGQHTSRIKEILGRQDFEEVIHRHNLVIDVPRGSGLAPATEPAPGLSRETTTGDGSSSER